MDFTSLLIAVVVVASMVLVGRLARARGRRPTSWIVTASIIGPFAIALLYLADMPSALKKITSPQQEN